MQLADGVLASPLVPCRCNLLSDANDRKLQRVNAAITDLGTEYDSDNNEAEAEVGTAGGREGGVGDAKMHGGEMRPPVKVDPPC